MYHLRAGSEVRKFRSARGGESAKKVARVRSVGKSAYICVWADGREEMEEVASAPRLMGAGYMVLSGFRDRIMVGICIIKRLMSGFENAKISLDVFHVEIILNALSMRV